MKRGSKVFAKGVALVLALSSMVGAVGCNKGGDDSTTTVIKVANYGGGVGKKWLDEAIVRFQTLIGDRSYEEGKTGVKFEITDSTGVSCEGMKTDGKHLFFLQDKYSTYFSEIQKGSVMDITDIVKEETLSEYGENVTIESKIDEDYRFAMKGNDGKYYMIPHYETLSGPSYDVDLFEEEGFYFAASDEGAAYDCPLTGQKYYFTEGALGSYNEKSVGNDGKSGTFDDGMPTTLNELVAMCGYIKSKGVYPFGVAGNHIDYSSHLLEALWTGLAGYEGRQAVVSHTGKVEYVTGESSEELWAGTGIKVPETEIDENVTSKTAWKAIDHVARYYAFAFMELAYKQNWFYEEFKKGGYTHKDAMKSFILNGIGGNPKIASHIEGTYWYNEAKNKHGLFTTYETYTGTAVKNIAHWHMPTSYANDPVTSEENKREEANTNTFTSNIMINGNIADREGLVRACKDFVKFLCTEQELQNFTASTGVSKALYSYTIDDTVLSQLDPYQQTVMSLRANNRIVNQYGDNATYRANANIMTYACSSPGYRPDYNNQVYNAVLDVIYRKGITGYDCFRLTGYEASNWEANYYVAD